MRRIEASISCGYTLAAMSIRQAGVPTPARGAPSAVIAVKDNVSDLNILQI